MLRRTDPRVVAWLDAEPAESVWTTTVTVFEIQTGLELLRPSKRRHDLESAFADLLEAELEGRVQPFDQAAAMAAGTIAAERQRAGRPVEVRDIQIAGIAKVRKATLATRNTRHFAELGINLVDPWAD